MEQKFLPNLSKDYNKLFDLLLEGYRVPCYVDYDGFKTEDSPQLRDIAEIKRHSEFYITIGARGIQYGGVNVWEQHTPTGTKTERQLFIEDCERMNLEWVKLPRVKIRLNGQLIADKILDAK